MTKKDNPLVEKYGEESRWVSWKYKIINGRKTKIPIQANGRNASTTDPSQWSTFNKIYETDLNTGIVFKPDQLLLGIDIDHVIEDGKIVHELSSVIGQFIIEANTYCELSPSGTGLHLYLALTEPLNLSLNKKAPFELYTSGRYFTTTLEPYKEALPVRTVTPEEALELLAMIDYPWKKEMRIKTEATRNNFSEQNDQDLLTKIFGSKNGLKFKKIYDGDMSDYGDDYSSAEMALCSHLSFWTQKNHEQIERIWTESPLGAREKTQERGDYRERTISKAIENCTETYNGKEFNQNQESDLGVENIKKSHKRDHVLTNYKIAQLLTKTQGIKTIGENKREIFLYKNGIYIPGENLLNTEIQSVLEELATIHTKKEILNKIKDSTGTNREEFNNMNKNLINLNNGVFDMDKRELLSHSPEYLFFTKSPVNYDRDADCPKIKNFLSEILNPKEITLIQEWVGFCLYRKYFIKKAIIFVGEKNTGKTTLLNLIRTLIGDKNVSGVNLQKMSSDKFALANLYNKQINIYDDLSFKDVNDNGAFKIATGGGLITAEYKFGNQFNFENYSKLTFSANKIPNVKDCDDDAYFHRWIIISFNRQAKKVNSFLLDEITSKEELSGFLNFAIAGLERLLKNQRFSYTDDTEAIKHEMLSSSSPLPDFASSVLAEGNTNDWITKEKMHTLYSEFVSKKKYTCMTINEFGKKLPKYVHYIHDSKHDGKRVWRNVKLKNSTANTGNERDEGLF